MIVSTTHGSIRGKQEEGVCVFRGIPYGGSCKGKRRFLPPVPAEDWTGVRDCTRNGPIAVQYGGSISGSPGLGPYFSGGEPERFGVAEERQDEDCLVLNLLTPAPDAAKRPVVVYIHGGGYATGSGSLVLGSHRWVREQDIVTVGVNHRLNVFGYLHLGELDPKYAESGLAGILDLVLALEWVQENIAAFGGDPGRVTLMGESGGGMKICTLMAMERAKGLFQRAIVESGSGAPGRVSVEEATATARRVLERLHIDPSRPEALTELPPEDILAASREEGGYGGLLNLSPVAEGINLMYNPSGAMAFPVSRDIPLLVGSSEDEMAVFIPNDTLPATEEALQKALLRDDGHGEPRQTGFTSENVDRVIAAFRAADRKGNDPGHLFLKIVSLSSMLGGGAFYQAMAQAEQGGAPVYHYLVSYDSKLPGAAGKRYAWHTADLPLQMRIVLDPESEPLSRRMSAMFAAFIRQGDPSVPGLRWPAFDCQERQVMVLDDPIRVERDPLRVEREVLEAARD